MARTKGFEVEYIQLALIDPNPWNPNRMTPEMFQKAKASIEDFGFIDPVPVRKVGDRYQIIDGEHRSRAAVSLGFTEIPCIILSVSEDEAKELTIILNETRGRSDESLMGDLLKDLAQRRERARMETLLPFDKGRLDQLLERREIDWSDLDKRREEMSQKESDPWVERVYRMPRSSASVIDDAIGRVREQGVDQDWRALEMIAADFLSG